MGSGFKVEYHMNHFLEAALIVAAFLSTKTKCT